MKATDPRIRLTRQEERDLHARAQAGDAEAADTLARSVLDWACRRAQDTRGDIDYEEAESLAYVAVAHALDRFDPDKGRLTTLVTWTVRNQMNLAKRDLEKRSREVTQLGIYKAPAREEPSYCDQEYTQKQVEAYRHAMKDLERADRRLAGMLRLRIERRWTLTRIGAEYGVTKQRVLQLTSAGMRYLQHRIPRLSELPRKKWGAGRPRLQTGRYRKGAA